MVRVSIEGDRIHFDVQGWDQLWAFKSHIDIPMSHVHEVRADPEPALGWWHGLKAPGTNIPGIITAGTFYDSDGAVFYDVHDPERTVVLELEHERYQRLVIEVEDPAAVVSMLRRAIHQQQA